VSITDQQLRDAAMDPALNSHRFKHERERACARERERERARAREREGGREGGRERGGERERQRERDRERERDYRNAIHTKHLCKGTKETCLSGERGLKVILDAR